MITYGKPQSESFYMISDAKISSKSGCGTTISAPHQTGWKQLGTYLTKGLGRDANLSYAAIQHVLFVQLAVPCLFYVLVHGLDVTQQAHNIKMTSYQRRCDVITSHRRWYDVILTLCARWEVPLCKCLRLLVCAWLGTCWNVYILCEFFV